MKLLLLLLISVVLLLYIALVNQPSKQQIVPLLTQPQFKAPSLTLENIFAPDHNWLNKLPPQKLITMMATGDIIPARSVNNQATRYNNFKWPYLKTAETLRSADITFINLETPLIQNCPVTSEGMVFCGDAKNMEGLIYAGVDIANLANNHSSNYGAKSVLATADLLLSQNISVTGLDKETILNIKGIKFAFLGYNDISKPQSGISNVDKQEVKDQIAFAKKKADVVIAAFHWGTEYQDQPDPRQVYLGRLAIDAGADLVIGNHPHWVQPIEIYKNKPIMYAHGNFVFDQEWSLKTKQGVVGKYTFYDGRLIDIEFLPVLIEDYGQPQFLTGLEKEKALKELKTNSEKRSRSKI